MLQNGPIHSGKEKCLTAYTERNYRKFMAISSRANIIYILLMSSVCFEKRAEEFLDYAPTYNVVAERFAFVKTIG
jgi:hypothetical protein